jgi:hypothetical protein
VILGSPRIAPTSLFWYSLEESRAAHIMRVLVALCLGLVATKALGQDLLGPTTTVEKATSAPPQISITPPRFLSGPHAAYPDGESQDFEVALKIWVGSDGSVERAEVKSGREPFSSIATRAALEFRFEPALSGGKPVRSVVLFRLEFRAPREEVKEAPTVARSVVEDSGAEHVQAPIEISVQGRRSPGSTRLITDSDARIIPGAEGDPVRAVQVLPGTVPTLMSGPFIGIRGAPPGMVGSWFDGIELPYLFHLARGTAVVHPWLVDSAALYAAGAPSRLGNAAGGHIEALAAAPEYRLRLSGRLRFTETALGAEVPFSKGKGSLMMAGRYSYTAPLVSLIAPAFALDYWDYQGRVNYKLTAKDRLEFTAFGSGDVSGRRVDGRVEEIFDGSFHRAALRYVRETAQTKTRAGLVYGHDLWDANQSQFRPRSHSLTAHVENARVVGKTSTLSWGASSSLRLQEDQYLASSDPNSITTFGRNDEHFALFIDYGWNPSARTSISLGLRGDVYASSNTPITRAALEAGVGPRFLLSHRLGRGLRLHNSFGYTAAPPSTGQRPPGRFFSVAGGLAHAFLSDAGIEFSLPGEIKLDTTLYHGVYLNTGDVGTLRNLSGQLQTVYEASSIARGQGQGYGLEVSLRRTLIGPIQGFLSYSLNRSTRTVGTVDGYAEFDRTHVFDAALGYSPGRHWLISIRASAFSGYPSRVDSVSLAADPPRTRPYYQVDAQVSKRWYVGQAGAFWGITMGVLNGTLQEETNDMFCTRDSCRESLVGPATIPTVGVEGEM